MSSPSPSFTPDVTTQPGHPSMGRRSEYQPKGGDAFGWGVKPGMLGVWVTGKTV